MSFSIVQGLKDEWLNKLKTKTNRKVCIYYKKEHRKSIVYFQCGDKLVIGEHRDDDHVLIVQKSDFADKTCFTLFLSNENVPRNFNEIPRKYANHLSITQYYEKPCALNYVVSSCNYTPLVSFIHNKRTFYAFMRNNSFYVCINDKRIKETLFVMCMNDRKSKNFVDRKNTLVVLLPTKHVMAYDAHKTAFSFLEDAAHDVPSNILSNAHNTLVMLNERIQARLRICAFAKIPLLNYNVDSVLDNIYKGMMCANRMVKNEGTDFEWYGTEETLTSGWYEKVVEIEIVGAMMIGVKRYGRGVSARLQGFVAKNTAGNDGGDGSGTYYEGKNAYEYEMMKSEHPDDRGNVTANVTGSIITGKEKIAHNNSSFELSSELKQSVLRSNWCDTMLENNAGVCGEETGKKYDDICTSYDLERKENYFNVAVEGIMSTDEKANKLDDVTEKENSEEIKTEEPNFIEMTVLKKFLKYVSNSKELFSELPRWLVRTGLISKQLKNLIRQLGNDYIRGCIDMLNKHNSVLASSKNMIFVHVKNENELKGVIKENWRVLRRFERLIYLDHDNYFYLKQGDGLPRERIGCNTQHKIPLSFLEMAFRGDAISNSYFYGLTKKNVDVLKVLEVYALKDQRINEIRSNIYKLLGLNEFKIEQNQTIRTSVICISCKNENILVVNDKINKCRRCFNKFDIESVENALISYIYERVRINEYVCGSCKNYCEKRLAMECMCGGRYQKVITDYSFIKNVVKTKKMCDYVDDIMAKV